MACWKIPPTMSWFDLAIGRRLVSIDARRLIRYCVAHATALIDSEPDCPVDNRRDRANVVNSANVVYSADVIGSVNLRRQLEADYRCHFSAGHHCHFSAHIGACVGSDLATL
jgi:hypothetical protein